MGEWKLPKDVETESIERVGGGGGGYLWESGVHDVTVKVAYVNQTAGEAKFLNVILSNNNGTTGELRENFCIRSGKGKGHKTYYVTKDGKKRPLPGYSIAENMCIAATGEDLDVCMDSAENKQVNIWNQEQGKALPAERPVVMSLVNKTIKVAVHQVIVDKQAPDANGKWVSTGESKTVNECKFFGNMEGKTSEEITKNKPATMFDKWAEKNTGAVINKSTKGQSSNSAAGIMNSSTTAETTGSLFQTDPPA